MRRYTPDEFFMLISSRKVSDKMQNALRLWLVDGMPPSEAAERCRVERSGLYKAFDRMRGHDRFDLRSIRVRVPHAHVAEFNREFKAMQQRWENGRADQRAEELEWKAGTAKIKGVEAPSDARAPTIPGTPAQTVDPATLPGYDPAEWWDEE